MNRSSTTTCPPRLRPRPHPLLALSVLVAAPLLSAQTTPAGSSSAPAAAAAGMADTVQAAQSTGQTGTSQTGTNPAGNGTSNPAADQTATPNLTQSRNSADLLPPAAPTEFQRLIANTTGEQLPIFGASLFRDVPSTFAPVQNIPVTPDYVVGPGDEVRLQVWGQVNQQGNYIVDRTGAISVPQVGTVHVAGVRYSDLTNFLRSQLGRVYRNFDLNVNLGQLRSVQIFVVGQVRRPGSYTVSSLSTLLNALFVSGGPSPQGSLRDIQLRRGQQTIAHFDLYDLLLRGDKSHDVPVEPGDVLFIPAVGPQVALLGSVNNPAIYELKGETTIADLLHLTGGETNLASPGLIRLERISDHELRSIDVLDQSQTLENTLRTGDIVTVSSIVDRFRNAVTLRGNVSNPGRYMWHAGMHVTDLIPNRESLVTRDYWLKRNQLGYLDALTPPSTTPGQGSLQVSTSAAPGTGATASSPNTQRSNTSASGGGNSVAAAASGSGSLFNPRTDVVLSAPDIDWTYAVIERLDKATLKTSLVPFNLGAAVLDHDAAQNPELLPNDVVTIFSTSDIRVPVSQQTRFVRLEGEFRSAGVYSVLPGETLRQLVARAGGFTSDAYLYASEFTRQSTQRVEQQRLNDYADQLEAQVVAATSTSTANALSPSGAAAVDTSAASARTAINRLRQLRPVGRVVLKLQPDSEGISALPDIALEDGDRFIVPKIPANVYVEGEVYSANAFLFTPGRRTKNYLKLAGGPDREADRKRSFVLRADGSVLSHQYGDFTHALIYPGDTIVVPPRITRRNILRDIVDLSGIVGQVGIGVAAINLLR